MASNAPTPTRIAFTDLEDLVPSEGAHEYLGQQEALATLATRISILGWEGAPILIDGHTIIDGHHRVAAAKMAGCYVEAITVEDLDDYDPAIRETFRGGDLGDYIRDLYEA